MPSKSKNSNSNNIVHLKIERPYLDELSSKPLMDRLASSEGHVRSIRRMVSEPRCADEILLQVAADKAALNQFSGQILDHELNACMQSCMDGDSGKRLKKVTKVLSTLLKQS